MNVLKILESIEIPRSLCEYWDVRVESSVESEIKFEDYELISCQKSPSLGAFIRVYENGMWLYASTTDLNSLESEILRLSKQAKTFSQQKRSEGKQPYNTRATFYERESYESERLDLAELTQKRELCQTYFETLKEFAQLRNVIVKYSDLYRIKYFRSSQNVKFNFDFNQCGLMFSYTASEGDDFFEDRKAFYADKLSDLSGKSALLREAIKESLKFINAKAVSPGDYPVVMDSEVVGVFAHESFGHKSEADFMLGDSEAKEAWAIGKKVGNECLSIVDWGAQMGTSGYCPIDDEGFETQKTYLIKNGILTGRLHSQKTASELNELPTGNGRALNFEFEPIVRMTNTYVEAGEESFEELISKVDLGILAMDVNHGSGLSTFTIAPRKCYMIRSGKIAEPVRVSVMSGSVFEALNQIEGCSNGLEICSSVFGGCGKMEQWPLPVGFGGPKVLISKLVVS